MKRRKTGDIWRDGRKDRYRVGWEKRGRDSVEWKEGKRIRYFLGAQTSNSALGIEEGK